MSKFLSAFGIIGGAYYFNSRNKWVDIDLDLYAKFYDAAVSYDRSALAEKVTKKLMNLGLFYTIDRDTYTPSLCGELGGVFLPNIIGVEEGIDPLGKSLESLFGIGFGFAEVGPVSQNVVYNNAEIKEEDDGNILQSKAIVGSFKNRYFTESFKYPIGMNIQASKEVKDMTPYLADKEFIEGVAELSTLTDYLVVNFTKGQNITHLLKEPKLTELISQLKQKRIYDMAVVALLQHESYEREQLKSAKLEQQQQQLNQDKINTTSASGESNKQSEGSQQIIYASEVFGIKTEKTEAFVPRIYIKLDEQEHTLQTILQIAKNYKGIGLEGLIIRSNNAASISKIAAATQGEIPLIVAGQFASPQDIISKVKSGAWAIQLGQDYREKGPKVVENLLSGVQIELQKMNIKNITELRGIDVN